MKKNIILQLYPLIITLFCSISCHIKDKKTVSQAKESSHLNITIHIDTDKFDHFKGPSEESLQALVKNNQRPYRIELSRSFISQKPLSEKAREMMSSKTNKNIILNYQNKKETLSKKYQLISCRPTELSLETYNSQLGGFYEKIVFTFQGLSSL